MSQTRATVDKTVALVILVTICMKAAYHCIFSLPSFFIYPLFTAETTTRPLPLNDTAFQISNSGRLIFMCAIPIRKEYWNLQSKDIIPQFILFKKASGLSDRTISDYKNLLRRFFLRFPDALDYPRERTLELLSTCKSLCY